MRSDIAHVSNMSHHGGTRVSKKYGGRVRIVHDPDHLYEDERGGPQGFTFRHRDWININRCPIEGFLRKNLGRPWDDVYSEFCAVNDSRSMLGRQMRKALTREVDTKGIYEGADGIVYKYQAGCQSYSSEYDKVTGKWTPLAKPFYYLAKDTPVDEYYAHPRTGLLCAPNLPKDYRRAQPFAHNWPKEEKPCETIVLRYGHEERRSFSFPYLHKVPSEWYQRELCGRRPRSRFYAWFHYEKKTTINYTWERLDGPFAKNAHFEGAEVSPYVDPVKVRYYQTRPDKYVKDVYGFWWYKKKETKTKETKRSCNRKDMVVIRDFLAKQAG